MTEIQIKYENNQMLVTSLQIASDFSKRHDHILRDIEGLRDIPNFGEMFNLTNIPDVYGRDRKAYLINRDGFTLLAMGFTGKDALEWKLKYIQAFNEMETRLNSPEFIMNRALEISKQRCDALLLENQELKPKAEFFDQVANSKTAIQMSEAAKVLNFKNVGRNKLFEILRSLKVLDGRNIPYQAYIDRGYFRTIEQKFNKPNGDININIKTAVYQKGLNWIRKLLIEHGYVAKENCD